MTHNQTTLAGHKIEAWRKSQRPRVTRAMLGDQLGVGGTAVQRWERDGTRPENGQIALLLDERGIAGARDWWEGAPIYPGHEEWWTAQCTQCDLRREDPAVRSCSRADCPNVGRNNQAKERIAA